VDIETSNLYAAFVWLTLEMLADGGEFVSITPRSFCNGPYFTPFRRHLANSASVRRIHLFDSRGDAFEDDEVLQENLIVHAVKGGTRRQVVISTGDCANVDSISMRDLTYDRFIHPSDRNAFFHVVSDELDEAIGEQMMALPATLADLGVTVSTGRVVDFRAMELLRHESESESFPLIYPVHFRDGYVSWPSEKWRKSQAIAADAVDKNLLVRSDHYVLTKRFSAKEEPRRVVAAVFDPSRVPGEYVGFENHLNYLHENGRGLAPTLARGLAAYLNSSFVDLYFRQFNGHTQVNAADLRSLRYPSRESLENLGDTLGHAFPRQDELDRLIREEMFAVTRNKRRDPVQGKRRIKQAIGILKALDVPKEQQNDRSAMTLLALADLKPSTPWSETGNPLRGITEMMDYFRDHFGKKYAPNTRETIRRFTIHQFAQMGLVLANPDNPSRPVNSPDNRYQLNAPLVKLLRTFGTDDWRLSLSFYLDTTDLINRLSPQERKMREVPVTLPDGGQLLLTPGGQNVLVKEIIEQFCPRFTPGGKLIYVGDTGDKKKHFDEECLRNLGVVIDEHGKIPDIVVHYTEKNWLVLVEAVTSHGPTNLKRHNELKELFRGSLAGLVFVTAFLTRKEMMKHLGDIAWETEVWISESPTHMIHFNGERFLGPYD